MPRGYRQSKRDANHSDLVEFARDIGLSVFDVHEVAGGLDLVIGCYGIDQRVEIKNPEQSKSDQKLTEAEESVFRNWQGRQPIIWRYRKDVLATRKAMMEEAQK